MASKRTQLVGDMFQAGAARARHGAYLLADRLQQSARDVGATA
jgi:hypothetical protein